MISAIPDSFFGGMELWWGMWWLGGNIKTHTDDNNDIR